MKVNQIVGEQKTMSRAAKGHEKYGKEGMQALAKAGRDGASEEKLDNIRDKHDKYDEGVAGPKKCWPGHRKVGTQPGTGKNKGKRVNDCEKIEEGEAVIKAIDDKHAELNDPTTGVTYNIDRTNPQGAASLQPDPETGSVKFDPTPEPAGTAAAGGAPNPLSAGAKVEIDTMEAGNDGTAGEAGTPVDPQPSPDLDPLSVPGDSVAEARKKDDELLEKMRTIAGLR